VANKATGPPVRPVCGAIDCYSNRLSHIIGDILDEVWKSKENGAVCVNTEEIIAEIEKVNRMQRSSGLIVGSADVKSLYPNLDIDFTIEKVCEMFSESEIGVEDVDYEELGQYLALTMEAKDMRKLGITEVCPERKSNRG
jgi:hypothetical protein